MQLSLWILKNWLEEFKPVLHTACHGSLSEHASNIESHICIEKARLYDGKSPMDPYTVYTGASHSFFCDNKQQVICFFRNDYLALDTEDVTLVLNQLLSAFSFYEAWERHMHLLMVRQCSLTELLDASDEVLKNPLLIHDSSDAIIAVSTSYLNIEVDESWYELLSYGATLPEKSAAFHRTDNAVFDHTNRRPFYIPAGFFPKGTWSQNIFRQEEWCGICVIIEFNQPLDAGMLHLFFLFSQMVQHYTNTQSEHNAFKLQSAFFLEAMEGQEEQISHLQRKLQASQWEPLDQMMLLKAVPLSLEYPAHTYLCRIFSRYSPYIFPAHMEHELLLLCNLSKLPQQKLFSFLGPWLKNSFYHCGASRPFWDLKQLSIACRQADLALQYGEREAGSIHEIHHHMIHFLRDVFQEHTDPSVLHPALQAIGDYDQKHHTDYYNTLFRYLQNERNSVLTAKCLNIHRNTLFHRLERIRDLFHLELENPEERFYLLLSFYCKIP